jgi:hypothetical protein
MLAAASPAAAQNTISGYVTNRNTGAAMEGIIVRIDGERTRSRVTDAQGHYLFVDLPDGQYSASASFGSGRCAPRSFLLSLGGRTNSQTGNFACLIAGQRLRIEGWTRDAVSGSGIPDAEIRICCFEGIEEQRIFSGADGNFVIHNLRDDTYTLTPSHPEYRFERESLRIVMGGWNKQAQFPAYARTYALTGKVIDISSGRDLANAEITRLDEAYLADPTQGGRWFTRSDREGFFSFDHVPNGRYTLTASLRGYVFEEESQVVTIRSEGQFLIFGARPEREGGPYALWGLIRTEERHGFRHGVEFDEEGRGVDGVDVRIERCRAPREGRTPEERCPDLVPVETVRTGVTGLWRREMNPGTYRITPTSPFYEFLPNLYYATVEGSDVMVDFQVSQVAPRPEDLARYAIAGRVTSDCPDGDDLDTGSGFWATGKPICISDRNRPLPVEHATVDLRYCRNAGYLGEGVHNERYRPACVGGGTTWLVETGSDGRFRFEGVEPGVYRLAPSNYGDARRSAREYGGQLQYEPGAYYLRLTVRDLENLNFRSHFREPTRTSQAPSDPNYGVIQQPVTPKTPPEEERSARTRVVVPGATRPPLAGAIERRPVARPFGAEETQAAGEPQPRGVTQRNLDRAAERARERRAALERRESREKTPRFPDLQVLSLRVSGSSRPAPNERVTLVATVQNAGRATATATKLTSRRSVDRTVNASDPRGPEASLRSLRPGESATLHLGLTAPKRTGRVYPAPSS